MNHAGRRRIAFVSCAEYTGGAEKYLELLMSGANSRMVVMQDSQITDVDLLFAANKQRLVPPDHELIQVARSVRTCFGD